MDRLVLSFAVEGPPQAWQRVVPKQGGIPFTPTKTRAYEKLVADVAGVSANVQRWRLTALSVGVEMRVYFADRRRRDLDNVSKCVLDGITKSRQVWDDDSQVDDLRILRGYDPERPRVEVMIWRPPSSEPSLGDRLLAKDEQLWAEYQARQAKEPAR